jgi:hypothetical protein
MKTQIIPRNSFSALLSGHWPCAIRIVRVTEGLVRPDSTWSVNFMLAIGSPHQQTVSIMMSQLQRHGRNQLDE